MYQVKGQIQGVADILFNKMLEDELEPGSSAGLKGRVSTEERVTEAWKRCYKDENGVYLPGWNLKVCLIEGCKKSGIKVGRGSAASYLSASVFPDKVLYFVSDGGSIIPDVDNVHVTWGRRPPRTGGACMVRRPMLNSGWLLDFTLTVVDDRRSPEEIHRSLVEAGMLVGLGSWRPEYGRFVITGWEVLKNGHSAKA